jgi:hypothetical protein
LLSAALIAAFAATAYAEDVAPAARVAPLAVPPLVHVAPMEGAAPAEGVTSYVAVPGGQARVTLSTNRFVPAPSDNSDQASKAEADGRRMIYDLAGHECGILRDTIAGDCHIESININILRLPPNPNATSRPDGFNVNASIVLRIAPK